MRPRTPAAPAGLVAVVVPAALVALLALGLAGAGDAATRDTIRFEFAEPHMGTAFRVVLFAGDSAEAAAAADAAFAVIADLDARLSDWDPDSELSRLGEVAGSGEGREVSVELWEVLSLARDWAERSDGAFDPTIGPLTRLWRWSARRGELPDSARLAAAKEAVGWRHMRLERGDPAGPDSGARSVRLERAGMALDLGGIAKGWAADAALSELARRGFLRALVDAGGDIALGDAPPGEDGWRVAVVAGERVEGVERIEGERVEGGEVESGEVESGEVESAEVDGGGALGGRTLVLANVGVASSGDRYRYVEVGGVRYSHILDPRTGLGVTVPRTVTVIARDAATADVMASALSVMDGEAGRALVASIPGARVVEGNGTAADRPKGAVGEPRIGAAETSIRRARGALETGTELTPRRAPTATRSTRPYAPTAAALPPPRHGDAAGSGPSGPSSPLTPSNPSSPSNPSNPSNPQSKGARP